MVLEIQVRPFSIAIMIPQLRTYAGSWSIPHAERLQHVSAPRVRMIQPHQPPERSHANQILLFDLLDVVLRRIVSRSLGKNFAGQSQRLFRISKKILNNGIGENSRFSAVNANLLGAAVGPVDDAFSRKCLLIETALNDAGFFTDATLAIALFPSEPPALVIDENMPFLEEPSPSPSPSTAPGVKVRVGSVIVGFCRPISSEL